MRVVATDSGVRGLDGPSVKKEDAIDAISTRKTQIIISSWMPRSVDWTAHMRVQQSVLEYILIGETDNGICGCPWKTWGFSSPWDWSDSDDSDFDASVSIALQSQEDGSCLRESKESTNGHDRTRGSISSNSGSQIGRTRREKPLYEIDGWERLELHSLSRLQLCRTDERWSSSRHSHTVSFRRKQDAAACCGHTLSPGGWKIENSFSVEEWHHCLNEIVVLVSCEPWRHLPWTLWRCWSTSQLLESLNLLQFVDMFKIVRPVRTVGPIE